MTFKHSKFEDSVTMRSLEKLAREKGWVKSEPPMTKSASKLDLNPSGSLVENVLKLCTGLRSAGYEKYASELENKLVNYKQAQTLYETSKEKGDDLVHAAHPKGSHKLEDVEGDEAVFEDIIDRHMKHVEVVEKQPTGKLASSRDIIGAVKVVLAQEQAAKTEEELIPLRANAAIEKLKAVLTTLSQAKTTILNKMNTTTLARSFDTNYNEIAATVNPLTKETISIKDVDSVLGDLGDIQNSINFFNWKDLGMFLGPLAIASIWRHFGDVADIASGDWDQKLRDKLTSFVDAAKASANKARAFMRGEADSEISSASKAPGQAITLKEVTMTEGPLGPLYRRIATLKQKLDSYKLVGSISRNKEAMDWIKEETDGLNNLTNRMDQVSDAQEAEMAKILEKEVAVLEGEVSQFASQWLPQV